MSDIELVQRLSKALQPELAGLRVTPSETALESLLMQALQDSRLNLEDMGGKD
ncbi:MULTISPECIES: hypothetical protein [Bifidobacterium]|uniref:Uncharacterized protein n=1 Tax=Bifidobacterium reuteri DSM 23975 TaxID=1437610 RepID=A0A087CSJ4_9BIFI|nr:MULTISPECIES: hypothetical protein [Bifidobacterium]KFI86244.1 hypothetical protein BREU_1417 [Bifidobacterium reuteri DSM 23975]